jgi:hypothetical protein
MLIRHLSAALAITALGATPALAQAAAKKPAIPDVEGTWSNASLTTEQRPAKFGDRLIMTPAEVREVEGSNNAEIVDGNTRVDPKAITIPKVGGDAPTGFRANPNYIGPAGNVGGYDRGWMENGFYVMRVAGQPRTSLLTTPDGRAPARKPGAPTPTRGPGNFNSMDNPEERPISERCLLSFGRNAGPPMFSNGFYNNNYEIIQGTQAVLINVEMVHDNRIIPLNAKHRTDGIRPWYGDSIGWYEGDSLVVETTNIPRAQAYYGSWETLKVTERFTRVGKDRLLYQFTIEDPQTWDHPWGGEYEFGRGPGRVMEYACHEGNYALEGVLAGARQAEAVAARTASASK